MMRKFMSGAAKRKKKASEQLQEKRQKGVIHNYINSKLNPAKIHDEETSAEQAISDSYHGKNCASSSEFDDITTYGSELKDASEKVNTCVDFYVESTEKLVMDTLAQDESCIIEAVGQKQSTDLSDGGECVEFAMESAAFQEEQKCSDGLKYPDDPALWPDIITDELREYFSCRQPNQNIQHVNNSCRRIGTKIRTLKEAHFYRKKKNLETVRRDWLIYSPTKCALFCYSCKLFTTSEQSLCKNGFTDWRNVAQRLSEHECSRTHVEAICHLSARAKLSERVDSLLVEEYHKECSYWRNVLQRAVAAIKFLAQRRLPFFGENETLFSPNNGNFLGSLELVSLFDPFMADHINKKANMGRGCTNYLSSTIVTELIQVMSERVLQEILERVNSAKYFGLIVDSTPDISHVDQLAIVIRYVDQNGEPIERFLKFVPIRSHSGNNLCDVVTSEFENWKIDLKNCRGQSYDNASNMSGPYSGLQARIKAISPLAEYVPCSAHSLNLVGANAVESCHQAVSYFGIVQGLYNFFSASTHRWDILKSNITAHNDQGLSLKSISRNRWSADADAVKALRNGYAEIISSLEIISENTTEVPAARHEASVLLSKLKKLETAVCTVVWNVLLQRINKVSKTLQSSICNISVIVSLFSSLIGSVQNVRDNFDSLESEAFELIGNNISYSIARKKHTTKSRMLDDSSEKEISLSVRDAFKFQCHYVMCDALITQLLKRKEAYELVNQRFGFMYKTNCSEEDVHSAAKAFQDTYHMDVDEDFHDEFEQFKLLFATEVSDPGKQLKSLRNMNIEHTFPNVDTALRILLSMPISNASSERSFSVLKRIKNRLRSSLSQEKLADISLLAIENDLTAKLDFEDIINNFAAKKCRKKVM